MTLNHRDNEVTSKRRQRAVTRIEDTLGLSLNQIFTPWALGQDAHHLGIQTLQYLGACANLLKHRPQQDVKRILDEAVNGTSGHRVKEPRKPQPKFFLALYQKLTRKQRRSEKRQARKSAVDEALSSKSESSSESDEDEEDVEEKSVSHPKEDDYHHDHDLRSHNDASHLHHTGISGTSYSGYKASQPEDGHDLYSDRNNASQPDDKNPQRLIGNAPHRTKRSHHSTQGSQSSWSSNSSLARHSAAPDQSPTVDQDKGPDLDLLDDLRYYGGLDKPDHDPNNNERDQTLRNLDFSRTPRPAPSSSPSHTERLISPNLPTPTSEKPSSSEQNTLSATDHLKATYNILKAEHDRDLLAYETACTTYAQKQPFSRKAQILPEKALESQSPTLPLKISAKTLEELERAQVAALKEDARWKSCQEEHARARAEELEAFTECIRVRKAVGEKEGALNSLRGLLRVEWGRARGCEL